jgi:hypothetical protein
MFEPAVYESKIGIVATAHGQDSTENRIDPRFVGDYSEQLEAVAIRFQQPVLNGLDIRFAGTVEIEEMFTECREAPRLSSWAASPGSDVKKQLTRRGRGSVLWVRNRFPFPVLVLPSPNPDR